MPDQNLPAGKEKIASASIRLGDDELALLFYLRRARKLAGATTLRVELEVTLTEITPINVLKLNPDPVLALRQD